jgi:hypothetical protein
VRILPTSTFVLLLVAITQSAALDIPYSGGKQEQTIEVRTVHEAAPTWTVSDLRYLSITFGNLFSVQFRMMDAEDSYRCSMDDSATSRIFLRVSTPGEAVQLADSGTTWDAQNSYPSPGASTPLAPVQGTYDSFPLPGYRFGFEMYCEGEDQRVNPNWNRLVFVKSGSHYAKFAITATQDTVWNVHFITGYRYIKTITLHYVVNETNDLTGNTSLLRPSRPNRSGSRFGARMEHELYNPLGIRLRREPGRYEPTVTVPRKP